MFAFCTQAKLEGQHAALRLRLKQALRLAKAPRTHVDTLTVADKAISILDGVLEVRLTPSCDHWPLPESLADQVHDQHAWVF